jgi:hypothetical protein
VARLTPGILIVLLALGLATSAHARTWLILPGGTGDCPDLNAGVDSAAASGDTLLLGPGTFTGPGNRKVDFQGKDMVVTSQAGASATVIDCQSSGRAFLLASGESGEISNLTFVNGDFNFGGAIFIVGGSPVIIDNVFTSNVGKDGGAIHVRGGSPLIQRNTFEANVASDWGGAVYIARDGSSVIDNNTFASNDGSFGGGAIYAEQQSITITNNLIRDNQATAGAIYVLAAAGVVEGNTIVENRVGGGAIYLSASTTVISRNVVAFTGPGAAMACQGGAVPTAGCNVYWGNAGGDSVCGTDLGDNLAVDPKFCGGYLSGNYTLRSDSPCTVAHSACGAQIGAFGVGCATTPTQSATWGQLKSLYLEGN